jgi:hypothetical protein
MSQRLTALTALERANANRFRHAARKREIAALDVPAGLELAAQTLENPEGYEGLRARLLITAVYRYGDTRAEHLLRGTGCNSETRIGQMTERQRGILAGLLRGQGSMVDRHGFARSVAA